MPVEDPGLETAAHANPDGERRRQTTDEPDVETETETEVEYTDAENESKTVLEQIRETTASAIGLCKRTLARIREPFVHDTELDSFSIPNAQTTTINGDVGWARRPHAVLECARCESAFDQHNARDPLDCPYCVAEYTPEEFPELELLSMHCPQCRGSLDHGIRHPNVFEVPQWAHCENCQYHWEFTHSF